MTISKYENATSFLLPRIIDGGLGGVLGVTFIYLVDLAKTRLQNQRSLHSPVSYEGLFDCVRKTYKKEGFLKMYKGYPLAASMMAPEKAIKMAANDFFRSHLSKENGSISVSREIVAGGLAGICQSSISTPLELIKIQLQDHGRTQGPPQVSFTGVSVPHSPTGYHVTKTIIANSGVFSLYNGIKPTMLRDTGFAMIYFPLLAHLNDLGPQTGPGKSVFWWSLTMAWVSASLSAALTTPMDVVKTRMQTLQKGLGEETYRGVFNAFYRIWKSEGVKAFFKGTGCRVIIIGPLFGITQMVYFLNIADKILGTEHSREEKPVMPRIIEKWKRRETSELSSNNPYEWK